jgi:hypothetical protein
MIPEKFGRNGVLGEPGDGAMGRAIAPSTPPCATIQARGARAAAPNAWTTPSPDDGSAPRRPHHRQGWRFEPAVKDGVKVSVRWLVKQTFQKSPRSPGAAVARFPSA